MTVAEALDFVQGRWNEADGNVPLFWALELMFEIYAQMGDPRGSAGLSTAWEPDAHKNEWILEIRDELNRRTVYFVTRSDERIAWFGTRSGYAEGGNEFFATTTYGSFRDAMRAVEAHVRANAR